MARYSYRSKPPAGAQINWSHPLAQGLAGAWLFNERSGVGFRDLVSGRSGLATNGVSWREGAFFQRSLTQHGAFEDGPDINGKPFSVAAAFSRIAYASTGGQFAIGTTASTRQLLHFRALNVTSMRFGLFSDDVDATVPSMDNRVVRLVATLDDKLSQKLYEAGVLRASRTSSGYFIGNRSVRFGQADNGNRDTEVHYAYVFNRALSADDAEWITQEPYALIQPASPVRRYFIGAIGSSILASGIPSTASLGTPTVQGPVAPAGIGSTATLGTPIVIGSVVPTGISSTAAVGTPTLLTDTDPIEPSGIASTLSFGTPSIQVSLGPSGIASTASFGTPVLVNTSRAFSIFIGGVDRSKYVRDPSIEVTAMIGGRASAKLRIIPEIVAEEVRSTYTPSLHDEIIIHHNATGHRLFAGQIESIARNVPGGRADYFTVDIKCTDYGVLCDRRTVAKYYTVALGSYAQIIANDLHANYLTGTGITYTYPQAIGAYIGEQDFNWLLVSEALDQICDAAGLDWLVTQYKELRLVDRSVGTGPAPFAIEQDNGFWRSLTSTQTIGRFANRVIVRTSGPPATWEDVAEANGELIYYTQYALLNEPTVTLDGVAQNVCEISERGSTSGWQWYYITGSQGLFANPVTAPSSGELIISYPSNASRVIISEDADSIADVGLYEHIEEVTDVSTDDALQAHADGILARMSFLPTNLDIETDKPGLQVGQLLTVNANGVSGTFLIEQIDIRMASHSYPRWHVRASDSAVRNGSGINLIRRIIKRLRQGTTDFFGGLPE